MKTITTYLLSFLCLHRLLKLKSVMAQTLGFIVLILFLATNLFAQLNLKDVDYMVGKNGALAELKPKTLNPNSKFCFDKRFWYTTNISGKIIKGCFYLNTKDGYVGVNGNMKDSNCDMNTNDPNFLFTVYTKKDGQGMGFTVDKRAGKQLLKIPMRLPNPTGKFVKRHGRNEGERRQFTELSLPTWAYYDPATGDYPKTTFRYFYGNGYPIDGNLKDHLGMFGLGFYLLGEETVLCLSQEKDDKFTTIDRLENVNFCFDGTNFKDEIAAAVREETQMIEDDKKQIEESQQGIISNNSYCKDFHQRILDHKAMILKNREAANKLMERHAPVNDPENQRIIASAQDPVNEAIRLRLETLADQCDANYTLTKIATTDAQRKRAKDRINCLQERINALIELEDKLIKINEENASNPAQGQLKKSVYYMTNIGKVTRIRCN
jgi:hypothetical protein